MARFKQVSTGLTLVCNREDVIRQYAKYPDLYIPLDGKTESKPETPKATEKSAETPKTPEKK